MSGTPRDAVEGNREETGARIKIPQVKSTMCSTKMDPEQGKRPKRARYSALKRRRSALKKKASELATLCDVKLCMICYASRGAEPEIWPENRSDVEEILTRFMQLSRADRDKKRFNMSMFSKNKNMGLGEDLGINKQWKEPRCDYDVWSPQLEEFSEKQLWELKATLDEKLEMLNRKINLLASNKHTNDPKDDNLLASNKHTNDPKDDGLNNTEGITAHHVRDFLDDSDLKQHKTVPLRPMPNLYYNVNSDHPQYMHSLMLLPTAANCSAVPVPASNDVTPSRLKLVQF